METISPCPPKVIPKNEKLCPKGSRIHTQVQKCCHKAAKYKNEIIVHNFLHLGARKRAWAPEKQLLSFCVSFCMQIKQCIAKTLLANINLVYRNYMKTTYSVMVAPIHKLLEFYQNFAKGNVFCIIWKPGGNIWVPRASIWRPGDSILRLAAAFRSPGATFGSPGKACRSPQATFGSPGQTFGSPEVAFWSPGATFCKNRCRRVSILCTKCT